MANPNTLYMQVHVIRAEGFPVEQYEQVMRELNSISGLITFHKQEIQIPSNAGKAVSEGALMLHDAEDEWFSVPEIGLSMGHSWACFFEQCQVYREALKLADDTLVILLTPESNSMRWLAAADDSRRENIFIKTSEWTEYIECDAAYPIAYVIMSQVLQSRFYDTMYERSSLGHQEPLGCMNDFCPDKSDVVYKLRTADICSSCLEEMLNSGIPEEYIIQGLNLFENLRKEMLYKKRHHFKLAQRAMHITRSNRRTRGITISISGINQEIDLNPKESALYLFYLTEQKGVPYGSLCFDRNRKKLLDIYSSINEWICEDTFDEADHAAIDKREAGIETTDKRALKNEMIIDGIVNNKPNRDSDLSRMRKKFTKVLGSEAAKEYYITGLTSDKDLAKGIRLSRGLVTYDYTVSHHLLGKYYKPKISL